MGPDVPGRRIGHSEAVGAPETSIDVSVDPAAVWAVLGDGWLYPLWVVGATHMRDVDDAWPAVGARLHHSVGPWPLQLSDATVVLASEPGRRLVLEARAWPAGTARVEITIESAPAGSRIRLAEEAASGIGWFVPSLVQAPFVLTRNREALARLADIAERRVHH
jgi:uncharacterized protein YndB with AHSA1/START domain